jgi:hypothetical protein
MDFPAAYFSRYSSSALETMAQMSDDPQISLPAVAR